MAVGRSRFQAEAEAPRRSFHSDHAGYTASARRRDGRRSRRRGGTDGATAGGGGKGGKGQGHAENDEEQTAAERREERNQVDDQIRQPDGVPTAANPTLTLATFGPSPIGMPNFIIDRFTIPPFLLPIYQACGTEYGVPWYVLASINRIETAFGTNLNVSTAGAQGWMQFMPATWKAYGVDANNDGRKDPYNPVDAICGAANYLEASGAQGGPARSDLRVQPRRLVRRRGSPLCPPVREHPRRPRQLDHRPDRGRALPGRGELSLRGRRVRARRKGRHRPSAVADPRGINIYSKEGASAIAVNDGTIQKIGQSKRLGKYVVLEDNYGNRFTYAELGSLAEAYPVPRERDDDSKAETFRAPKRQKGEGRRPRSSAQPANTEDLRERVSAFPERDGAAPMSFDPSERAFERLGYESFESQFGPLRFDAKKMELRRLEEGSKVLAGTILGSIGSGGELAPHLNFAIRPAGRGAPQINPKPILDGWKLLEATHLYRAMGKDPFEDSAAEPGQVLLMSKEQAARALVAESGVSIYECGIADIRSGQIDVRIMRLLLYLARSGFDLTVTSLKCGHGVYTSSGNISAHSVGSAVDIAQINGLPVLGNQGTGSITETLIKQILELQGAMTPDQVISLMEMGGPTFVMGDHADHVHVGYSISGAPTPGGALAENLATDERLLDSSQWRRLIQPARRDREPRGQAHEEAPGLSRPQGRVSPTRRPGPQVQG